MGDYFKFVTRQWVPKNGCVTVSLPLIQSVYIVAYGLWSHSSLSLLFPYANNNPTVKTLGNLYGETSIIAGSITGTGTSITVSNESATYDEPLTIYELRK